jgi:hypothetical protein
MKLNLIKQKAKKDPKLYSALNDELVRLNEIKSWKAAFFSTIVCLLIFTVISFLYKFNDLFAVTLTTIFVGTGAHYTAFYLFVRR